MRIHPSSQMRRRQETCRGMPKEIRASELLLSVLQVIQKWGG